MLKFPPKTKADEDVLKETIERAVDLLVRVKQGLATEQDEVDLKAHLVELEMIRADDFLQHLVNVGIGQRFAAELSQYS